MADITVIKLNNYCKIDEFQFLNLLSNQRREIIYKYKSYKDAYRSYIGALLIRYVVCERVMCKNSDLIFDNNIYGKPFLLSHNNCFFNLSHSGNYVSCIVDEKECGIDIEPISVLDVNIAKDYFHEDEYSRILSFENSSDAANYFYFLWTIKEAYLKTLGLGLSKQLSSFYVGKDTKDKIIVSDKEKHSIKPEHYNSILTEDRYYISSTSFSEPVYTFINDCDFMEMINTCDGFTCENNM